MVFPVTSSDIPLEFDTLPALKAVHWHGAGACRVYTMARLYCQGGDLHLSLTAFEREPAPQSRILLALGAQEGLLAAEVSPATHSLRLLPNGATLEQPGTPLPLADPARLSGADEQGWYWSARLLLPRSELAAAGINTALDATFRAGLLKYQEGKPGLGASFPPEDWQHPLDLCSFSPFQIVDY